MKKNVTKNPLFVINRVKNDNKEVLMVLNISTTKIKIEGRSFVDNAWHLEATEDNLGFAPQKLVKEIKRRSHKGRMSPELSKLCNCAFQKAQERNPWFAQYALAI